jgi:hypothetical protein
MTKFILFMMFFVSPPAKPGKQVWALSSTSHFEFETMDACKKFGTHLQERLASTATTTMRGWCANQKTGDSTFDQMVGKPLPKNDPDIYEIEPPAGH